MLNGQPLLPCYVSLLGVAPIVRRQRCEVLCRDGWLCATRPPTAWLLLRRDSPRGAPDRASEEPLVLPIHADAALPDYVVPLAAYEQGRSKRWQAGDRFRMQFGGRKGSWFRGTIVSTRGLTGEPEADPCLLYTSPSPRD